MYIIYVCIHINAYIYIYIYIYAYIYICTHKRKHKHRPKCRYTHTQTHTHLADTYICIDVDIYRIARGEQGSRDGRLGVGALGVSGTHASDEHGATEKRSPPTRSLEISPAFTSAIRYSSTFVWTCMHTTSMLASARSFQGYRYVCKRSHTHTRARDHAHVHAHTHA